MKAQDVEVLESLLQRVRSALNSLVGDITLALEVIAARRRGPASAQRSSDSPIDEVVDDSRFAVRWKGRECPLGPTLVFRLFRRLALSKNRYVSFEQLIEDVWDGQRSAAAVRSAVRDLRRRFKAAGMAELAGAIEGRTGHYRLRMDSIPSSPTSHGNPTETAR